MDGSVPYLDQSNEEFLIRAGAQKEEHHQPEPEQRSNEAQRVEELGGDHERYGRQADIERARPSCAEHMRRLVG